MPPCSTWNIPPAGYSAFMRNPAGLTAVAILLLVAGFGAGLMVGERRQPEERRPAAGARTADPAVTMRSDPGPAGKSSDPATPTEEAAQLRERVRVLEVELQFLRETPPAAPARIGDDAAQRVFEDMVSMMRGGNNDPDRLRSLFAGLAQLDAAAAKSFIDRYRKLPAGKESETERFVAVELALMSGGPDAAQFLQSLLRDSSLDPSFRSQVLNQIGVNGGLVSIKRIPVDESLGSTAMGLIRSDKIEERRAGAGLLGGVATPASRLELERMLMQDADLGVRLSVIHSLGLVGDPSSRKLLEPIAAQSQDAGLQRAAAAAIKELDRGPR